MREGENATDDKERDWIERVVAESVAACRSMFELLRIHEFGKQADGISSSCEASKGRKSEGRSCLGRFNLGLSTDNVHPEGKFVFVHIVVLRLANQITQHR